MSQSKIELAVGENPQKLLSSKAFLKKWLNVHEHCSYATIFQHPMFILPWYAVFAPEWQPVLIMSWDINDKLKGL